MKTITVAFVLAFALTVFGVAASNAEVYSWTDENGVKHFSDRRPADAKGAKPAFAEYEYDEAADKKRNKTESQELEKVVKTIDAEHAKTEREEKLRQKEAEANRPPTMEEKVEVERRKLNLKIAELESLPLDHFGSQKNKIRSIGYYKYRLEDLAKNPDKYFTEPTRFEGNIKIPEENAKKQ
ncbi:MAG: DUF4124 domain-containing protein [Proteobacteria bacterium]|nr:DUF4124 domain-containing protein [Pseudomonadota bacterium]